MLKSFNLDKINQYRKELMGISAIGILAVHAIRKEVAIPAILQHILSLGGYGVDIFILLSGIGMAFSTAKISGGYWRWYKHRFLRILVPSLLIIIPARILLCVLSRESLASIPWFLTTIPFWTQHNGDWFLVFFIIVAYLLAPLIKKAYDRTRHQLLTTIGICTLFVLIGNSFFGLLKTDSQVWYNISYIAQRFPGFLSATTLHI